MTGERLTQRDVYLTVRSGRPDAADPSPLGSSSRRASPAELGPERLGRLCFYSLSPWLTGLPNAPESAIFQMEMGLSSSTTSSRSSPRFSAALGHHNCVPHPPPPPPLPSLSFLCVPVLENLLIVAPAFFAATLKCKTEGREGGEKTKQVFSRSGSQ